MSDVKITDFDYKEISKEVYKVRINKPGTNTPVKKGALIEKADNEFQVLDVLDHKNGMQAMAVAPIINGKVDTKHIVLAYAGTDEWNDIETDAQMIGFGNTETLNTSFGSGRYSEIHDAQSKTALEFADKIRAEYPDSIITTTGHSLGESTAMYVALKRGFFNRGFNGPDIHKMISKDEIEYMREHPEQFMNYRNIHDLIGDIKGNKTETAIYLNYGDIPNPHSLATWKFNEEGELMNSDFEIMRDGLKPKQEMGIKLLDLKNFKRMLSLRGCTENEKIFLDVEQTRIISNAVKELSTIAYENIKKERDKAVLEAEKIWDSTLEVPPGFHLTPQEARTAYMEGGVTYDTTVGRIKREFDPKVEKAKEINENFIELYEKVNKTIEEMLANDAHLKRDYDLWTKEMK